MMGRHRTSIRRIAWLQLAVFVLGGLLAPVAHRATHDRHALPVSSEVCDHARHDVAFEHAAPSYGDDLCALCSRHLLVLFVLSVPQPVPLDMAEGPAPGAEAAHKAAVLQQHVRGPPSLI